MTGQSRKLLKFTKKILFSLRFENSGAQKGYKKRWMAQKTIARFRIPVRYTKRRFAISCFRQKRNRKIIQWS